MGEFKFDTIDIPPDWTTGEPRQIKARISGSGNFALLNEPQITPAENWKTYPGRGDFRPGDNASFSGTKDFQFSAVPRKGGGQSVAFAFSYFDPARGAYIQITSHEKKINVAGEDIAGDEPPADAVPQPEPVKK